MRQFSKRGRETAGQNSAVDNRRDVENCADIAIAARRRHSRGSPQATAVPVDEEPVEELLDDEFEEEFELLDEPAESPDFESPDFAAGSLADDEPLRLSVR